ncbi:MAG: hypothetical protein M1812_007110 [Candelaria pacifica]|nr:MAG: hypothetical protein M1812_007110 [Candelaria pacifica]
MQLRNTIKRPTRFEEDPTIYQAPKRAPQTYLPKAARPHSCVEFNPNLPPAAFPTLDRVRPESSATSALSANVPEGDYSTDLAPLYQVTPTSAQKASEAHCPKPARCKWYPDCTQDSLIGFDPKSHLNNGPPNPIFVQNWELAGQLMQRTDEEWFEQEMLTSEDEDDDHPMSDNRVRAPYNPSPHSSSQALTPSSTQSNPQIGPLPDLPQVVWNDLTLAVQLLIFKFLSRRNPPPTVRNKLGLTKPTYTKIARARTLQQSLEDTEDERIKEVIDKQNKLLMQGQKVDQLAFSDIFNQHLESPIRIAAQTNYEVKTMAEIEVGRRFLACRNLDVEILGEWGIESAEPNARLPLKAHQALEQRPRNDELISPNQETTMTLDNTIILDTTMNFETTMNFDTTMTFNTPEPQPQSTIKKLALPTIPAPNTQTPPPSKRAKPTRNNNNNNTPCPAPTALLNPKPTTLPNPKPNELNLTTTSPKLNPIGPITHAEYMYIKDIQKLGLDAVELGHLPSLTSKRKVGAGVDDDDDEEEEGGQQSADPGVVGGGDGGDGGGRGNGGGVGNGGNEKAKKDKTKINNERSIKRRLEKLKNERKGKKKGTGTGTGTGTGILKSKRVGKGN